MSPTPQAFLKAQRHLARRDQVLRRLIAAVGPCTLRCNRDRFLALARSIMAQQISTRAAAAITTRLEQALGPAGISADAILRAAPEILRQAGLSAAKARALYDLAERVHDGRVPLKRLHRLADEEVIAALLPVRGIGRWTAEMFLIFALGRLDVLPVDDWGLRVGVQRQYALPEPPRKGCLRQLAEPWRPYRSIATWYFWRSLAQA